MVRLKIAISGKVNSGKDTFSNELAKELYSIDNDASCVFFSFAKPLKDIAETMFPLPDMHQWLWGSSEERKNVIPGAFKDGVPLTVRQLLLDIGTEFGRSYNKNIWVDSTIFAIDKSISESRRRIPIVTDCRFHNEFKALKENNFIMIRIKRDAASNIQHVSDTEQDSIHDNEFDYVIKNNSTLHDLELHARVTAQMITRKHIEKNSIENQS